MSLSEAFPVWTALSEKAGWEKDEERLPENMVYRTLQEVSSIERDLAICRQRIWIEP